MKKMMKMTTKSISILQKKPSAEQLYGGRNLGRKKEKMLSRVTTTTSGDEYMLHSSIQGTAQYPKQKIKSLRNQNESDGANNDSQERRFFGQKSLTTINDYEGGSDPR